MDLGAEAGFLGDGGEDGPDAGLRVLHGLVGELARDGAHLVGAHRRGLGRGRRGAGDGRLDLGSHLRRHQHVRRARGARPAGG